MFAKTSLQSQNQVRYTWRCILIMTRGAGSGRSAYSLLAFACGASWLFGSQKRRSSTDMNHDEAQGQLSDVEMTRLWNRLRDQRKKCLATMVSGTSTANLGGGPVRIATREILWWWLPEGQDITKRWERRVVIGVCRESVCSVSPCVIPSFRNALSFFIGAHRCDR